MDLRPVPGLWAMRCGLPPSGSIERSWRQSGCVALRVFGRFGPPHRSEPTSLLDPRCTGGKAESCLRRQTAQLKRRPLHAYSCSFHSRRRRWHGFKYATRGPRSGRDGSAWFMFTEERRADLMILRTVNITGLCLGEVIQMSWKHTLNNGAVNKAQEKPARAELDGFRSTRVEHLRKNLTFAFHFHSELIRGLLE